MIFGYKTQQDKTLSKVLFLQKYGNLVSKDVILEEHKSKRNIISYSSKRFSATCSVRSLHEKVRAEGIDVSLGTVYLLKPFFVAYPSERELSLCLCKLCLNVSLLHEVLKKKAKQNGEELPTTSTTAFFMYGSTCTKTTNGYYTWACVTGKCKKCSNLKVASLKCKTSTYTTSLRQFETINETFQKKDKDGNIKEKYCSKTTYVTTPTSYSDIHSKLEEKTSSYLMHKYQVYNDSYHWNYILDFKTMGKYFIMTLVRI